MREKCEETGFPTNPPRLWNAVDEPPAHPARHLTNPGELQATRSPWNLSLSLHGPHSGDSVGIYTQERDLGGLAGPEILGMLKLKAALLTALVTSEPDVPLCARHCG